MSKPAKAASSQGGDRDIEKVIESIRLDNIEKDIRSHTARLDVRKIHAIEDVVDPRAGERDSIKLKKVLSRRANNMAADIRVQGALAKAKLEERGVYITDARDAFEHEEIIWKNKSHSSSYLVKRKFDKPELHQFAKSLSGQDKKEFEHLSKENLYRMSQKMRVSVCLGSYLAVVGANARIPGCRNALFCDRTSSRRRKMPWTGLGSSTQRSTHTERAPSISSSYIRSKPANSAYAVAPLLTTNTLRQYQDGQRRRPGIGEAEGRHCRQERRRCWQ